MEEAVDQKRLVLDGPTSVLCHRSIFTNTDADDIPFKWRVVSSHFQPSKVGATQFDKQLRPGGS